jgi:hypothetical protein
MLTDEKFLDDPRRAVQLGLGIYSPLWPTFIAAAGAGVAFWAWAQWARGKAQHEFAAAPGLDMAAIPEPILFEPPAPEPEAVIEVEIEAVANDLAAPPPEPAPEPEPVALEAIEPIVEFLVVDAVPEPEPAAMEPAPLEPAPVVRKAVRRKAAAPVAPPEPAIAAAIAPEPESAREPPKPPRKVRPLAAANISPRQARAAKAAGGPKRRGPRRKG